MISQFGNGFLIVIKLLVFFIHIVNCNSDDVDHIAKEGGTTHLDNHHNHNLSIVLWSKISISNCNNGSHSPINAIDILYHPRLRFQVLLMQPCYLSRGAGIGSCIKKQSLSKDEFTKKWAIINKKQNSSMMRSSLISFRYYAYILML